jgi:Flp pilus assembly protein TadG
MPSVLRSAHRTRQARPGAAAAELAALLPVLMMVVLGCVDFGRFASLYIALTNAARAGAGLGCMHPNTPATNSAWQAQVTQAVAAEMSQDPGFDSTKFSATALSVTESSGMWRVEVSATYSFTTLVSWPGIPSNVTLSRTVVLRGIR